MAIRLTLEFSSLSEAAEFLIGAATKPSPAQPSAPTPAPSANDARRRPGRPRKTEPAEEVPATAPSRETEPAEEVPTTAPSTGAQGNVPTVEDVRAAANKLAEAKGIAQVRAVLGEFQAQRVSDLKAGDYGFFIARCNELAV